MLRPDGEPELALHLDARDERGQELPAADAAEPLARPELGRREQRAGDGAGGVDDGVQVRVVVVVDVRGDAVQQGGVLGVGELGAFVAEDGGRGGAEEGAEGFVLHSVISPRSWGQLHAVFFSFFFVFFFLSGFH